MIEYTANKFYCESTCCTHGGPDKLGCLSVEEWKDVLSGMEIDDYRDIRSIAQKSGVELTGSENLDNSIIFNNFLKTLASNDSISPEMKEKIAKFGKVYEGLLPEIAELSVKDDIRNNHICHYNQKLIDKYLLG